jgi:DNA-directed RNA polymerase subunit N
MSCSEYVVDTRNLTGFVVTGFGPARRGAQQARSLLLPVRCMDCGGVLGHYHTRWPELCSQMPPHQALEVLRVKRDCCRRTLLTCVDTTSSILMYDTANRARSPYDTSAQHVFVHDAHSVAESRRLDALANGAEPSGARHGDPAQQKAPHSEGPREHAKAQPTPPKSLPRRVEDARLVKAH